MIPMAFVKSNQELVKSNQQQEQFAKRCLTCQTTCETTDRHLFTNDPYGKSLKAKLLAITGLKVSCDDEFPDYVCSRCAAAIQTAFSLRTRSRRTERKDPPYKCPACAKIFYAEYHLRCHLKMQLTCARSLFNKKGVLKCPECPKEFSSKENMSKQTSQHSKFERNNSKSSFAFKIHESPIRHDSQLQEKPLRDDEPLFDQPESNESSIELCATNKQTQPDDIDSINDNKNEPQRQHLSKEVRQEPVALDPPVQMEMSDNENSIKPTNDDQESIDHKARCIRYSCAVPTCEEYFTYRQDLLNHYMSQHTIGCNPLQCPVCEKLIWFHTSMRLHLTLHISAEYKCPYCPRTCRHLKNISHIQRQTGEQLLKRLKCPSRYIKTYDLDAYSKTLSIISLGECNICKRKFFTKRGLHYHLKSHKVIKELQCTSCGKQFSMKSKLQRHMRGVRCNGKHKLLVEDSIYKDPQAEQGNATPDVDDLASKTVNCSSEENSEQKCSTEPFINLGASCEERACTNIISIDTMKTEPLSATESCQSTIDSSAIEFEKQHALKELNFIIEEEISEDENRVPGTQMELDKDNKNFNTEQFSNQKSSAKQPVQNDFINLDDESSSFDLELSNKEERADDDKLTFKTMNEAKSNCYFLCPVPQCYKMFTSRLDIIRHCINHHDITSIPLLCTKRFYRRNKTHNCLIECADIE